MKYFATILLLLPTMSLLSQTDKSRCEELDGLYSASKSRAITFVYLNTNGCSNCLASLEKIFKSDEKGVVSNVYYVVGGIEAEEINYYFQHVMGEKAEKFAILKSPQCSNGFKSNEQSKVRVISNGEVIFEKLLKNIAFDSIPFDQPQSVHVNLLGESPIEMENDFLLKGGVFHILDSSTILCLNTKYQSLLSIDIETNEASEILKSKDIPINFDTVLRNRFDDSVKRTILSDGLLKQFELTNLSVNEAGSIFFSGKVRYKQIEDSIQSTMNFPVILKTNKELDTFDVFPVKGLKEKGYAVFPDHFYIRNRACFIKVFKTGDKSLKERYHSVAKLARDDGQFEFSEFVLTLPNYFYSNQLLFNFSNGTFYKYGSSIYHIFNVFPKVFDISQENSSHYFPRHEHQQSVFNFEDYHFDIRYRSLDFHKFKGYSFLISRDKTDESSSTLLEIWDNNIRNKPYFKTVKLFSQDKPTNNQTVEAFSSKDKLFVLRLENGKYKIYQFEITVS